MRTFLSNDYLTLLCRVIFGAIFIYASLDKIAEPGQFNHRHVTREDVPKLFKILRNLGER